MGWESREGREEERLITERSERLDIKRETSEGGRESREQGGEEGSCLSGVDLKVVPVRVMLPIDASLLTRILVGLAVAGIIRGGARMRERR